MLEPNPEVVEFDVHLQVRTTPERIVGLIAGLREIAVAPVKMEMIDLQGNRLLFELPEMVFDPKVVSREEFQHFYKRYSKDETPSVLPSSVFNKLAAGVDEDKKSFDKKGKVESVDRGALVERCRAVLEGNVEDFRGTKTRGLINGFLGYSESVVAQLSSRPEV